MTYTWTTQIHNTTAARNGIQVETWVHKPQGWENIGIMQVDTLDDAYKAAESIRRDFAPQHTIKTPVIIAAVRFAPRGHHRLVTWHGTYNEGNTNA